MAKDTEVVNSEPKIEDLPEPQISGNQGGQPLDRAGGSSVTLEAIGELVKREVQSVKDTRLGKHESRLDDLEGAISQYESLKGGTVDADALGTMQGKKALADMRAELETLKGSNVAAPSAGAGEELGREQEASILKENQIAVDDPRIVELLRSGEYSSKAEYLKDLNEKAFAWRQVDAKKPVPGIGAVAQVVPSIPSADPDATEKYKADMIAARGKARLGRQIKEDARKAGVDVDHIGFG